MSQIIQRYYIITNEIWRQTNETMKCSQVCNRLAKSQGYSARTEKDMCFTSGNATSAAATTDRHELSGLVAILTVPTTLLYVTPHNTMPDVVQWQTETAIPTVVHWHCWVTWRPLCVSLFQFASCKSIFTWFRFFQKDKRAKHKNLPRNWYNFLYS
jgi:hypothetical protein